ncbi:BnaC04g05560D [Brassica napus]|uniref:BnaC04g05560D protein n=1 Tax=Brassica napus TaxID=3708 RepID=A0A078G797_BRANA|nr:BnaC04g05560D [Brassica napus]
MTIDQLPKCLFKEGTETQVEKVNNSCRTSILAKVAKYCPDEYKEVSEDPLFAQIVAIHVHKLQFSARAIHTFVCKQLLSAKRLKYNDEPDLEIDDWEYDGGFWSKLRLVYLCVIAGILMAKDEKIWLMEAVPDIGSLLGQKLREGVTTMRCRNWKGSAKISYEDIITIESNFASTGDVFPSISTSGNFKDVIIDAEFARPCEMKDERVDLIIDMQRNNSEEDGSDEEAAVETSDTEIEEEIESTRVSPTKKRKNRFRDTGAESRKKRLLCQRSTEKYRDLEEEMKSYIQSMFNSSFTALGLEVREIIEDRFTKLEEKILSSQTQGGAPANTQTRGADPFWTPSAAAAATAPASVFGRAPAPTPASTEAPASVSTRGLDPSRSAASALYRSRASATAHIGGPANAAKTRSQTKDADLSDVFGSLFSTLDYNVGTQEHLQKTMGNLTQESNVDGFDPSQDKQSKGPSDFTTPMTSFWPEIFKTPFLIDSDDIEVRCKAKDYELVFLPEEKWAKLTEWTLNPTVLQIGPSTFDAELASRIIGPNIWLKNFDMDAMIYLFREKTALRQWSPDRVAFLNCMFSNQIITAYGKFDGNRRGYKIDDNFLEYGRGELPYHGSTGSVWSVDFDRLYISICVNQIHWISICVNLVNQTIDVFDCGGKKNSRVVEAFAVLIPRIVKAVQSPERKKDFNFIECHLLGLDFSLVNDENIKEAQHKIAFDLWEAANDVVLQSRMSTFKPPKQKRGLGFFVCESCESRNKITMTSSSNSSARFPRISNHGVPTRCWCGEGITTFGSLTAENKYRRFYRFAQEITKFEERVMEKVKSEIVRVEAEMSEKLKEKVNLEFARVAQDMKQKLKIATVAMVVVGEIVGLWTSLTV